MSLPLTVRDFDLKALKLINALVRCGGVRYFLLYVVYFLDYFFPSNANDEKSAENYAATYLFVLFLTSIIWGMIKCSRGNLFWVCSLVCTMCYRGFCSFFFLNIFLLIFSFFNAKWWTSPRLGAKSKGFLHPQKCLIGILCWLVIWPSHREANASYLSNSLHLVHSSVL